MGGGKGTSTSTTEPPKEIMEAYKQSLSLGRQAIAQPYQQYQGQMVAGLNPTQLQGISNVNASQGAALPYIQQGASYTNQAAQGVNPGMINQFMSPYLNNVVGATQRNLLESNAQQQQAMKSGAIQSGAFGGDRARFGQAELARQQGLAGGQVIGGLLNQGYGQALAGAQQNIQNMMQGGQMLGGLGMSAQQSMMQGAQAQMAAGAQQQATEQAGLQAMYDQYLQRQAYPYQQAQFFANIAQGIGAGAGGTTSQTPAAPNMGSQILGGLTAIGSIWPSDERLKENIEPIGKTFDGQNIYKYNFKDQPGRKQMGLIAQDVEKHHPEAVKTLGGIKMVDYDAATEDAANRSHKAFGGSSMGGLVSPGMEREAFAQGGFGGIPYADYMKTMSWLPEGELGYRGQSPGSTLPAGYKMEDLKKMAEGSSFDELNAMSEKDIANLKGGLGKIGTSLGLSPTTSGRDDRAPSYSGPLSDFGSGVTNFFSGVGTALGFADGGGVVPRHGYQTDGAVRQESGLPAFLVGAESGGDTQADNNLGYVGRGQFGAGRLEDAKRAGVIPPDLTPEQFKNDPNIQKAVEDWHVSDINKFIQDRGLGSFVGQEIKGIPVTEQGLLAVAHLGGKGGMSKFLQSGGRYDPADANGTHLSDYLKLAAGASGGVAPDVVSMDTAGVVPPPAAEANVQPAAGEPNARRRNIVENILNQDMSDQARTGMLAAGLAMLGGSSPYFGVNVGKGALTGLQAYYKGLENQRETAKAAADIESTLATARSTSETAGGIGQTNLLNLQNEYISKVAIAKSKGQPYPSWSDFLEMRGQSGKGWDAFNPAIVLEPGQPTSAPQPDVFAPEPNAAEPANVPAEEPTTSLPAPAPDEPYSPDNSPSATIQPTDVNEDIPNTIPSQNPALLTLQGTPEAQAQLKTLRDQGYVIDLNNRRIPITSTAEMETRQKLNNEASSQFTKLQENIPQINSTLNEISKVLQGFETTKLTDLQKNVSGLIYNITGNRESLENATAGDLLDKLFKQLSLVSQVGGDAGAAGIEKIRQVEGASGTGTMSAPALREVIGKAKALNEWNQDRIKDWGSFINKNKASGISDAMRTNWLQSWGDKLDAYYVPKNVANTPVKDESLWKKNDQGNYDLKNFKEGWQYVMPNGKIARFSIEEGRPKFTAVGQ